MLLVSSFDSRLTVTATAPSGRVFSVLAGNDNLSLHNRVQLTLDSTHHRPAGCSPTKHLYHEERLPTYPSLLSLKLHSSSTGSFHRAECDSQSAIPRPHVQGCTPTKVLTRLRLLPSLVLDLLLLQEGQTRSRVAQLGLRRVTSSR